MHLAIFTVIFLMGIVILLNSDERNQLPCRYLDSINITDGIRQTDDSIEFNGMIFAKDQYARIDYVLENGMTHKIVEPYARGCICHMKKCVRLCCPNGSFYQNRLCHPHNASERVDRRHRRLETAILDEHKQTKSIILDHHFAYVNDRSCHDRYIADEYQMIYTGSILFEGKHLTHWEYCLNPMPSEDNQNEQLELKALVCVNSKQSVVLAVGMMLSVPFIILTVLAYIFLSELHNLYGKCLVNHLMSLVCGYIILGMVQLNDSFFIRAETIACIVLFVFIASFVWVSVISVELYLNFRSPDRMNKTIELKQFVLYMMYVWMLSSIFAIIVYTIDSYRRDADHGLKACLLDYKNSTRCAYFYIPIWIILAINQTFFTLTAFKMERTKQHHRENARQIMILLMASRDLEQNGMTNEENFALYSRLHIVICLTWICKGFALFADDKLVIYSNVTYAVQGLVIFVLFVMNRHVLHLFHRRWKQLVSKSNGMDLNKNIAVPNGTNVR